MDLNTVTFDKSQLLVGRQSVISFTDGAGVRQTIVATAAGAITGSGNLTATLTAAGMVGSPIALNVPVLNGDSVEAWAHKVRLALKANATIDAFFEIVPSLDATITLRRKAAAANDATMNLALADGTSTGVTEDATSDITVEGAASGPTTHLVVEYVSHVPGLTVASAQGIGGANRPAFTALTWESGRAEMFRVRCKEIAKVKTLLGSLSGHKEGSATVYFRKPSDAAGKAALVSETDFPAALYRDPAEMEVAASNASEVTLILASLKDGAVDFTANATT